VNITISVVYIVWYGNLTASSKSLMQNFVTGIGTTTWWGINKPYGVGPLTFKKAVADNYSQGKTLTTSSIWSSVYKAISTGQFPLDPNAIYLLISSRYITIDYNFILYQFIPLTIITFCIFSDVTQSGFCTSFCGWHSYASSSTATYKFGWIGIPPSTCGGCIPQTTSPNGDAGTDAAVSVIAHELAEAATDPTGGGWCYSGTSTSCFSSGTVENADQCAWYFPSKTLLNGYYYNLAMGTQKFLVQSNWNLGTKTCTMA